MSCASGGKYCDREGCYLAKQVKNQAEAGGLSRDALNRYLDRVQNEPCDQPRERDRAVNRARR